jgi:DNA-binding transcriptional LysR family regulator
MLVLNDEVLTRLTSQDYEGQLVLGVPSDIVYPAIPQVLHRFNAAFPRMKVQLVSSFTSRLRRMLERGEVHLALATEPQLESGGETLLERPLIWVGAVDGQQWRSRPLRLAFEEMCIFRRAVQRALDLSGTPWEMAVESDNTRSIEASISADLAVSACIEGTEPRYVAQIRHGGALPDLPQVKINMYGGDMAKSEPELALADFVRQAFEVM